MGYSVDTNVLIDVYRRFYPGDVFPSLRRKFDEYVNNGTFVFTKSVLDELEQVHDDCLLWARSFNDAFIEETEYWTEAEEIGAKNEFILKVGDSKQNADPYVIALAMKKGLTVLSSEAKNGNKLHLACKNCKVPSVNLLEFMRNEGWKF